MKDKLDKEAIEKLESLSKRIKTGAQVVQWETDKNSEYYELSVTIKKND